MPQFLFRITKLKFSFFLIFFSDSFRSEKEIGAEIRSAILSGIVTRHAPLSDWPIFSLSPVTVPEVFAKLNSFQFRARFESGEELSVAKTVP